MEPIPFYQVFSAYEEEQSQIREEDLLRMRSKYPKAARRVLKEVMQECDLLEYQDSFMYHENPDRVQIEMIAGKIYQRLSNINEEEKVMRAQSFLMQEPEFHPPWSRPGQPPNNLQPPQYSIPYPDRPHFGMTPKPTPPSPCHEGRCPTVIPSYEENGKPDWLKLLIEALLIEEMAHRRQQNRQKEIWNQ